jgi:hypothetical protein
MTIDAVTYSFLSSGSTLAKTLFKMVADRRIVAKAALQAVDPAAERDLNALQDADLIGVGSSGEKYYVTAKGLKVARDLENLPLA